MLQEQVETQANESLQGAAEAEAVARQEVAAAREDAKAAREDAKAVRAALGKVGAGVCP